MENQNADTSSASQAQAEPVVKPLPGYLYHATTNEHARKIATNGLIAMSVGGQEGAYLCMSGKESGAVTKVSRANDYIFRIAKADLDRGDWHFSGAGKAEWRSTKGIDASKLWYRRNLPKNANWKAVSENKFPAEWKPLP